MAQPELSIVIPTYNRPDLLARCLRSVRQHAPRETEILVVDDGSTRRQGMAVAREFGLQGLRLDPTARLLHRRQRRNPRRQCSGGRDTQR